jgi:Ca2+-binding EF-hand superfamily protein|tara:strand:- start:342 stop:593 length:252 start_codon:yes stop_codon:yes gene_type:complete
MATDSIAVDLRDALTKNAKRVVDLFREWDEDGDGTVSKKEFRKAIPLIVPDVPKAAVDELFDEWDPDKSGMISLAELIKKLRR